MWLTANPKNHSSQQQVVADCTRSAAAWFSYIAEGGKLHPDFFSYQFVRVHTIGCVVKADSV